jgi:hypothetical protein
MMLVDTRRFFELLTQHMAWYPLMQIQDVYKLVYQGVMGSEHMLPSREEYGRQLAKEYEALQTGSTLRLFEPVRADGELLRINLRPYKAKKSGPDGLISPLVETAKLVFGTKDELRLAWDGFLQLFLQGDGLGFVADEARRFTEKLEQQEYPPVHHSEIYTRNYQPAYRLIAIQFVSGLGLADAS